MKFAHIALLGAVSAIRMRSTKTQNCTSYNCGDQGDLNNTQDDQGEWNNTDQGDWNNTQGDQGEGEEEYESGPSASDIFKMCDANDDKKLSKKEAKRCAVKAFKG